MTLLKGRWNGTPGQVKDLRKESWTFSFWTHPKDVRQILSCDFGFIVDIFWGCQIMSASYVVGLHNLSTIIHKLSSFSPLLPLFLPLQVHPGGLACGGDHHEGLLKPDAACDSGVCWSLPGSALSPQGSPPAVGYRLHGSLYSVRIHASLFSETFLCSPFLM